MSILHNKTTIRTLAQSAIYNERTDRCRLRYVLKGKYKHRAPVTLVLKEHLNSKLHVEPL